MAHATFQAHNLWHEPGAYSEYYVNPKVLSSYRKLRNMNTYARLAEEQPEISGHKCSMYCWTMIAYKKLSPTASYKHQTLTTRMSDVT